MQLLIGQSANFTGFAFPDQCCFVLAPGLHMAIEAVVGEIDLSAYEPFGPRVVPFQNFVPLLEPVQFFRNASPELLGMVYRFTINALVVFQTLDVCLFAEMLRTLKPALLLQDGVNVGIGSGDGRLLWHAYSS